MPSPDMIEDPEQPFTHYLVSMGAQGPPCDSATLAANMAVAFQDAGIVPMFGLTYVTQYPVAANRVALRDAWQQMDEEAKAEIGARWPVFAIAVEMLVRQTGEEGEDGN